MAQNRENDLIRFNLNELADRWSSPVVCRDQRSLDRFSGGLLNARTLANRDSLGVGPAGKIKIGKKVAYPVDSLIAYLKAQQVEQS